MTVNARGLYVLSLMVTMVAFAISTNIAAYLVSI